VRAGIHLKSPVFLGLRNQTKNTGKAFQMNRTIRRLLARRKQKILARLGPAIGGREPLVEGQPELTTQRIHYEMAERTQAIPCGGIGAIHQLVRSVGLAERMDSDLQILKQPRPYQDSDHVLNIVYNVLCGGKVLDDIEVRRNDAGFLDALGARTIPDPTTAGDYCRRFDAAAVWRLMGIINRVRVEVWNLQGAGFTSETARIDVDGSLVPTTGECKEGMDMSYKGVWGYHPLLVSLANTREPLFIINRSGNRPSHEGAPAVLDQAIELCSRAGFQDVLLRGDTDFTMAAHLDRWTAAGVRFVFGYDANPSFVNCAENLGDEEYSELVRKADQLFTGRPRSKPPRIKEEIIREREYFNQRLVSEDVAEFEHRPSKTRQTYRIVVLRKLIIEEQGQLTLGTIHRYFFFVTNDWKLSLEQVVAEANDRCNQENLIEQLKNGARALHSPLNTLDANWAYMVIASLAWTLKAWFALLLPIAARWREQHERDRQLLLHMELRTFLQQLILIPAQIVRSGRRLIYRLLAWRPQLPSLFRLLDAL
jgi:hypothetical protein